MMPLTFTEYCRKRVIETKLDNSKKVKCEAITPISNDDDIDISAISAGEELCDDDVSDISAGEEPSNEKKSVFEHTNDQLRFISTLCCLGY